jgi:hypothetical protein
MKAFTSVTVLMSDLPLYEETTRYWAASYTRIAEI